MNKQTLVKTLKQYGIKSTEVLKAIENVPREVFVKSGDESLAYENHPLPIGYDQTISQPYIVAQMTEILLTPDARKILEIGTGSGYQAAILSLLVKEVYTVERILPLLEEAQTKFKKMHYDNIYTLYGDGYEGWADHAPYDGIIVTAASETAPPALLDQLAENGRLIIPIGQVPGSQQLQLFTKKGDTYHIEIFEQVSFVPMLTGTYKT